MRFSTRRGAIVAVLLGSTVLSATAQGYAVAPPEPEAAQTITGRGFGHGRGMSQYGAQGAAIAGRSAKSILDFYYPGTTVGKASGAIRIRISADTTDGVRVVAANKLRLRDLKTGKVFTLPTASTRAQWSIDPYGERGAKVSSYNAKAKKWTLWKTLTGMAQFEGPTVISLVLPSGAVVRYRGVLRSADLSGAHFDTVNVLSLELYLRGVVPREALTSWRPAALQVQSVAARTYSVYHRNRAAKRAYDLCDTTSCQVYGGYNSEKSQTNAAIAATAGQIRLYRSKPIMAEFSSSNGGATADGDAAYQVLKLDGWDAYPGNKNPNVTWRVTRTSAQLQAAFGVGSLRSLRVVRRTKVGPSGGRVLSVEAIGSKGKVVLTGDQVRSRLGLRSAWFAFAGVQPTSVGMPTGSQLGSG
ncbi:SpoIID/LytB domain-containing protein [Kribbella sp. CA-293567]|uniref:SpoIID/LytB domain-containing protein n=1 Tax=Kribbella sp. CA-293567 TaxID=3002436 RepID=UPI0022DE8E67|nr:SpoIID/LytB domain-containing protein [Kribbella sp. CA-293567]WBQ04088.1 SpoIID/LytB domain-containing protein [Kribbella sp. CA-293567]